MTISTKEAAIGDFRSTISIYVGDDAAAEVGMDEKNEIRAILLGISL